MLMRRRPLIATHPTDRRLGKKGPDKIEASGQLCRCRRSRARGAWDWVVTAAVLLRPPLLSRRQVLRPPPLLLLRFLWSLVLQFESRVHLSTAQFPLRREKVVIVVLLVLLVLLLVIASAEETSVRPERIRGVSISAARGEAMAAIWRLQPHAETAATTAATTATR